MIDIPMPPPSYYAAPPPSTMIELYLPAMTVDWLCRILGVRAGAGKRVYGCASWQIGGCLVILPRTDPQITRADQDAIRLHEQAHCNGWPADHPR